MISLHERFPYKDTESVPLVNPDVLSVILALLRKLHAEYPRLNLEFTESAFKVMTAKDKEAFASKLQDLVKDSDQQDAIMDATEGAQAASGHPFVMSKKNVTIRIHAKPDAKSPVIGIVSYGEPVNAITIKDDWLEVEAKPDWAFPSTVTTTSSAWVARVLLDSQGVKTTVFTEGTSLPNSVSNPFVTPAAQPQASVASSNPFAPQPAKSSNPFDVPPAQSTLATSSKNPFATSSAAPAQGSSSNPFEGKIRTTPSQSSLTQPTGPSVPAPDPKAAAPTGPKLAQGWASTFKKSGPSPSKTNVNPFNKTPSKSTLSATGDINTVDPFTEDVAPWFRAFPEVIVKYLLFLFRKGPDYAQALIKPDKLESLVFVMFIENNVADDANSADDLTSADIGPTGIRFTPGDSKLRTSTLQKFSFTMSHPNSNNLMSLLRYMIVDLMSSSKDRGLSTIEIVLDSPPFVKRTDLNKFHFAVFDAVLSHLANTKVLMDSKVPNTKLLMNIGKLASLILERIVQGEWTENEEAAAQWLSKLLRQLVDDNAYLSTHAESAYGVGVLRPAVESLFKSMNRIVLHQISRPQESPQMLAMIIHRVIEDQGVIVGDGNKDPEMVACLADRAMAMLDSKVDIAVETGRNLWRVLLLRKMKDIMALSPTPIPVPANTAVLPIGEMMYRVGEMRPFIDDAIMKAWSGYLASKQRIITTGQARHTRRAAHVMKRDKRLKMDKSQLAELKSIQISRLNAEHKLEAESGRRRKHKQLDSRRLVQQEWKRIEGELYRERGLWGAMKPNPFDRWELDVIEGPSRIRKRLVLNVHFFKQYPYVPQQENGISDEEASRVSFYL